MGYLKAIALVLFSTAAALVVGEFGLRRFLAPAQPQCLERGERCVFAEYHPVLGYHGAPNRRGHFGPAPVRQDASGFRVTPHKVPPDAPRVVYVGDSQTWGYGVANRFTLPAQTQRSLEREKKVFRIFNLGVSGYGVDQVLLSYLIHGRPLHPRWVVYTVFENDFEEAAAVSFWNSHKPRFYFRGSELCLGNVPVPRQRGWANNFPLSQHQGVFGLATLGLISRVELPLWYLNLRDSFRGTGVEGDLRCVTRDPGPDSDPTQLGLKLIESLQEAVRRDGANLLLVLSPMLTTLKDPTPEGAFFGPVVRFAKEKGISYVALKPLLQRAHPESLYLDAGHFSQKATQLLGPHLAALIQ